MGKKKFNNSDGQKFYLLHRSQTDEAYAGDERPSDFVLVPATDNGNEVKKQQRDTSKADAVRLKGQRDHVTPMGFNNDGYDYSQHMKVMGEGNFIGKNGGARPDAGNIVELPADALPSIGELDRRLEAVTISHELMDSDLRAALFNEDDGEGDFEELLDDFITDAMMEPEVPDFDFDAHIAELIARSERNTHKNATGPRGWENDQALMSRGKRKDDKYDDEEYHDLDPWEEADEETDEDEDDDDDENDGSDEQRRGKKSAVRSSNQNDINFEKTLEEYDEKEIGYLSEAEDEDIQGGIELDGDDLLFNQAIEEFIQDKKDHILAEGVTVKKGARALEDDVAADTVDLKKEVKEQKMRQIAGQLELEEFDDINDSHEGILTCQSYLREKRPEELWDCESIISTYSTLDNHPSIIKDPSSSRFKPYKSRFTRAAEKQDAIHATGSSVFSGTSEAGSVSSYSVSGYQSMQSMASNDKVEVGVRVGMISPQHVPQKPSLIVLKGKMGLPEGFGPLKPYQRLLAKTGENVDTEEEHDSAVPSMLLTTDALSKLTLSTMKIEEAKKKNNRTKLKFKGGRLGRVKEGVEEDSDTGDVNDTRDADNEDSDSDSDYEEEEETETVNTTASIMRMRGETPEQRKARKTLVKIDKQNRRLLKKQMKMAYKDEESRQNGIVGRQQAINNVGVFKYSL